MFTLVASTQLHFLKHNNSDKVRRQKTGNELFPIISQSFSQLFIREAYSRQILHFSQCRHFTTTLSKWLLLLYL